VLLARVTIARDNNDDADDDRSVNPKRGLAPVDVICASQRIPSLTWIKDIAAVFE
jgi:hypothetical protein